MKVWNVYVGRWGLHRKRPCRWMPRETCTFVIVRANLQFELTSNYRVGIWVSGVWRRNATGRPPADALQLHRRPVMKKKSAAAAATNDKHLAALETGTFASMLPLVEHCAVTRYDDGDPRTVGWLTIKTQGAAWVVQVKDPDTGNSFTSIADTLDKALETASLMLACDEAPWTPDPWLKAKGAPKKK